MPAKFDRFYIGNVTSDGQVTALRPYAIPENAYSQLLNTYLFRGRVCKKAGTLKLEAFNAPYKPYSDRMRIFLGFAAVTNDFSLILPVGFQLTIGASFSMGSAFYQIMTLGTGVNNLLSINTGTYNGTTRELDLAAPNSSGLPVFYYPTLPVTGSATYEFPSAAGFVSGYNPAIGFDQRNTYLWGTAEGWIAQNAPLGSAYYWDSANNDTMTTCTYRGIAADNVVLFMSNYKKAIGLSTGIATWQYGSSVQAFVPKTNPVDFIVTCRAMAYFKSRLLFGNTIENISTVDMTFRNRIRYSAAVSPFAATAWYDGLGYEGGFIDLPTNESITAFASLQDRLLIYCPTSTWELVYTHNELTPFVVQRINSELGAESPNSIIEFDQRVLGVGVTGIHECTGLSVNRIDTKVPQLAFQIGNLANRITSIYGIRDYRNELVYWTMPLFERTNDFPFPNACLVYNYANDAFGVIEESITAFGYFQYEVAPDNAPTINPLSQLIWAGNQQGYTFLVDRDTYRNADSLYISNIVAGSNPDEFDITCTNFNVRTATGSSFQGFVIISGGSGYSGFDGVICPIVNIDGPNTFTITNDTGVVTGYTGGAQMRVVYNPIVKTKDYNFYIDQGVDFSIRRIDFLLTRNDTLESRTSVGIYPSSSTVNTTQDGVDNGSLFGTGALDLYGLTPIELKSERVWHPFYPSITGNYIQMRLGLTDEQMMLPACAENNFELHALVFHTTPTSYRL